MLLNTISFSFGHITTIFFPFDGVFSSAFADLTSGTSAVRIIEARELIMVSVSSDGIMEKKVFHSVRSWSGGEKGSGSKALIVTALTPVKSSGCNSVLRIAMADAIDR